MFSTKIYKNARKPSRKNVNPLKNRTFSHAHVLADIPVKPAHITTLSRGVSHTDRHSFFHPRSVISGVFSRKSHSQAINVSLSEATKHKDSFVCRSNYYVSATSSKAHSNSFGPLRINIDAAHPQQWIDVESAYLHDRGQYAERYEHEYSTLAFLSAASKSFIDASKGVAVEIQNPFYLNIDQNDTDVVGQYKKVYALYCDVLLKSNVHHDSYNIHDLSVSIQHYTNELIVLYGLVLGEYSPFNLTLSQFAKRYPVYANEMSIFSNPEFRLDKAVESTMMKKITTFFQVNNKNEKTLGDIYKESCVQLFVEHPYLPKLTR